MRAFSIAILAVAATSSATPSTQAVIDSLLRHHLTAMGTDRWNRAELGLPDDVVIYAPLGERGRAGSDDDFVKGPCMAFFHEVTRTDAIVINRTDVVVGGDAAWVQAEYVQSSTGDQGPPTHHTQRAMGIALAVNKQWRLEAMGYGELVSDHDLVTLEPRFSTNALPKDPPKLTGDPELAKVAAAWIATGFTGHGAHAGVLASGSAPGEIAAGDGVAKLVKGWDALGMRAASIEATVLAGGSAGFVHAEVAFPIKNTKRAAPLHLNVGVVREADGWHWAVIGYGGPALM